jgi:hypothetical protein
MKPYRISAALLVVVGVIGMASGQEATSVGTSAANFLKIGLGAKAAGMGESYITMAEDASCMYWNPGAMTRIGSASISFSNIQWLVGTNVSYLAGTVPFSIGTVGLDIAYFGSGDIEETTLQRQDGTGRVISANDMAIGLGFARDLTDRFSVGFKVKYIREQLASVTADAYAFDIGSVFTTTFLNDMTIGIVLSNFGGTLRFEGRDLSVTQVVPGSPTNKQIPAVLQTNEWPLPLFFRFGVATDVFRTSTLKLTASYTITDSRDFQARHNLGAAMTVLDVVTLRGGYRINYDESTFSAGAGVMLSTGSIGRLSVDYAFTQFGLLSSVHQFTLGVMFD